MQVISTMNDLDAKLAECDVASKISDDELRRVFTTFQMDFSTQLPTDPFGPRTSTLRCLSTNGYQVGTTIR